MSARPDLPCSGRVGDDPPHPLSAHRPPPGVDEDDDEDERPIGDPDDEDWDGDDDEDDDEEPLQVRH